MSLLDPRIRIERELYDRLKQRAAERGYASVEEFIRHTLEQASRGDSQSQESQDDAMLRKQLQGLGYLK